VQEASSKFMSTCVLRPSVLFGRGDTQLIPSIHACLAKQETPWIVGDGTNLWDVTYVDNVADAHVLAAENLMSSKTAAGEIFFVQNNEPISFRDLSLEIWKNFGHVCCGFPTTPRTASSFFRQRYSSSVSAIDDVILCTHKRTRYIQR
jgi:sterol-4alpha-carboxylate 3-dehydrogenase (decarboxylating)